MRWSSSRLCECLFAAAPWARARGVSGLATAAGAGSGRLDLAAVAAQLSAPTKPNVVVLVGAGISCSAGIPDFRTPGTGLYDNLQEYGLPFPEAIFDLGFYAENPKPFRRLCRELWPGNFSPTPTHAFIRLLHDHGMLLRCFTQNIDSLETAAGLPADALVAAHGNFDGAHVLGTRAPVPVSELKQAALSGEMEPWEALTAKYGGLVKPDIVFYGEQLPMRFLECAQSDMPRADLLLVIGTSLAVQPFASLVGEVREGTPRLLINRERVGDTVASSRQPFDFGGTQPDGWVEGDCDDAVRELAALLGWETELDAVLKECAKPDRV